MNGKLKTAARHLASLLFPPRCLFCGEVTAIGESCPCESDAAKQKLIGDMAVNFASAARKTPSVSLIVSSYIYSGAAAEAVKRYKFRSSFESARDLAKIMADDARDFSELAECELVAAVPSYKNQSKHAARLAFEAAKELGIKYGENVLRKTRRTEKQHELTRKQREKNLKDCFEVPPYADVKGKSVLLVDDVVTTGSTLETAAKALLSAGAAKVCALTFCSAKPGR